MGAHSSAWDDGYECYYKGIRNNPFAPDGEQPDVHLAKRWQEGFSDAQESAVEAFKRELLELQREVT